MVVKSIEVVMTQRVANCGGLLSVLQILTTKDSSSEGFDCTQSFPFLMVVS